jgi:hypothetical protein
MNEQDYLSLRTTNINVRISPILKSQLINQGARMGVNLSDYINYVITKDMSGENDPTHSAEYKELERLLRRTQTELQRFTSQAEPFKDWIGKDLTIDGKTHHFEHPADLLTFFAQNFKFKK